MTSHNTVLFLCTGNYYRNRFAEAYFGLVQKPGHFTVNAARN